MIDVYSWATPNGHKVHIMLEETGLAYNVHGVNIGAGDQFNTRVSRHQPEQQDPGNRRFRGPQGRRRQAVRACSNPARF